MIKRLCLALISFSFILILLFFESVSFVSGYEYPLGSDWRSTQPLPYSLASHNSFSYGEKIYIVGGATSDDTSNMIISSQNSSGLLATWSLSSNLPDTRYWGSTSVKNGDVYYLGGAKFTGSTAVNKDVYRLHIGEQESSWEIQVPLPESRALGSSVIVNNRIYYAGGFNDSGRKDDIFYANINPDGDLESWTTSTISLPEPLYGLSMVEHDNYIYIIGGNNAADISQNKVYRSQVNHDGSLTNWVELNSLPLTNYRGHALIANNKIIVIGGEHGAGAFLDNIFYADILPGGLISDWQEGANSLPVPISSGSISRVGDYLYLTGGLTTNYNYLDTVYYARINDIVDLGVSLYKQTDSPWADDLYDSANLWTSDPSFYRWGCAVTSAAMVFNYYGLNQMEDGSSLDPGSLNEWLKSQSDGYIGNGNTNWLALSRLSKRISDFNGVSFNALEFSRTVASDHDIVKNEIDNEIPSILKVPEHFVVAKGYTDDNILINDPYYERDDLTAYENTFQNISTFTPSNTDLSYLMLIVNDDVSIKVFDGDNNEVGDLIIEEPIADPAGEITSNTEPLKIVYVAKPSSGKYRIEISADGKTNYILDAYLYDEEGNVKQFSFDDSIHKETDTYHIDFDKNDNSDSYVLENATYTTLIKEIKNLYDNKELKLGAYIEISTKLKLAQTAQKNNTLEKRYLNDLKNTVRKLYRNKEISSFANEYLTKRIEFLIDNI